jgi:hypothetical protein
MLKVVKDKDELQIKNSLPEFIEGSSSPVSTSSQDTIKAVSSSKVIEHDLIRESVSQINKSNTTQPENIIDSMGRNIKGKLPEVFKEDQTPLESEQSAILSYVGKH